jgi:hypothetical protein
LSRGDKNLISWKNTEENMLGEKFLEQCKHINLAARGVKDLKAIMEEKTKENNR